MITQEKFIKSIESKVWIRRKIIEKMFRLFSLFKKDKKIDRTKKKSNFVYITICNRKSLKICQKSIHSFLINSNIHPKKIVIISDGSWETENAKKYFKKYNDLIFFDNWENNAVYFKEKSEYELYEWSLKQIWGKKLVSILRYSEEDIVLFSDPDVLWFGSPLKESDLEIENLLKISLDNSHNYDTNLIKKLNLEYLYNEPPINCGILITKGNYVLKDQTAREAISIESQNPGKFSEQTVLAILSHKMGSTWDENQIISSISDVVSPILKISKYDNKVIARHYLWALKWLFWRDYITKI